MSSRSFRAGAVVAPLILVVTLLAGCQLFPGSPDFVVTTTVDGVDAVPGDGVCEVTVGADDCSLRAAISEANASSVVASVTVPPGSYALTVPGTDDGNAGGDLDVAPTSGSMVIVATSPAGFEIDAAGADGGLDVRSGNVPVLGMGVRGAAGDGVAVRSGAYLAFTFASIHDNGGAGVRVEAGAHGQLWNTTVSTNGAGGVANQGLTTAAFATIAHNTGGGFTGAGDNSPTAGIRLDSSLVLDQASGADCADGALSETFTASNSCFVVGTGNYTAGQPTLDPLTGGFLPVHPISYPSPGSGRDDVPVGSGACITGSPLMRDQVGTPRPVGTACDRGASEGPVPVSLVVDDAADDHDVDPGDGACVNASGHCDLRSAIDESNARPGADTVTIADGVDPHLTLVSQDDDNTGGDLDITDALTVEGGGATVTSSANDRLVDQHTPTQTVVLRDLHLVGGVATGQPRGGGAIWSEGTLTVERSTIEGAEGSPTGAIEHQGTGTTSQTLLTLTDVVVSAAEGQAAVRTVLGRLERVTIDGTVGGSGLAMNGGRVIDSSITDNEVSGLLATSVPLDQLVFDLDVFSSTFSGNSGGGVHVQPNAAVYLNQSTVSGNAAAVGAAVTTEAGNGADLVDGTANLLGSTVYGNTGATSFDGVVGMVQSAIGGASGALCSATMATQGYNVLDDATCGIAGTGDVVVADLGLDPLALNGGATETHLPAPGSPVIDHVPAASSAWVACDHTDTDQRGVERPQGLACDSGSVEAEIAPADTFVVDTATDAVDASPGDGRCRTAAATCSLRAAVEEANLRGGPQAIQIAGGIDPVLSIAGRGEDAAATGDLDITDWVVISGAGATVDAAGVDRVFDTRGCTGCVVRINDLTIVGGDASTGPDPGAGAIASAGGLELTDVVLDGNTGSGAGAVGVLAAAPVPGQPVDETDATRLTDVAVSDNTGGPAVSVSGGELGVTGSHIHDNVGGGVAVTGARSFGLSDSTVSGNSGAAGAGVSAAAETILITGSWISDNHATGFGGGLLTAGDLTVVRSTISGNSASDGGGIRTTSGRAQIQSSTVSSNSATVQGAALTSAVPSFFVVVSTIAGNMGPTSVAGTGQFVESIVVAGSGVACSGFASTSDWNLFGDTSCGTGGTNAVGAPDLGPLQDNGGPTPTHAPLAGSPARDAISSAATVPSGIPGINLPACPLFVFGSTDQRGVARPQGAACDVGAVEQ